jgi:hypothetical protein
MIYFKIMSTILFLSKMNLKFCKKKQQKKHVFLQFIKLQQKPITKGTF